MTPYTASEQADILAAVQARFRDEPIQQMHPTATQGQWEPLAGKLTIELGWHYRPAPKPPTQRERDDDAFEQWNEAEKPVHGSQFRDAWHAGVAHGRKEAKQ